MNEEGEPDFARMMAPVAQLYDLFPGLRLTAPDVVFADFTKLTLPGVTTSSTAPRTATAPARRFDHLF